MPEGKPPKFLEPLKKRRDFADLIFEAPFVKLEAKEVEAMPLFRVRAGTFEGKVLYREIEAPTEEELGQRLEKEGLYPIEIREKGILRLSSLRRKASARPGDLLVFNHGLATLLKAGLQLLDSLEALKASKSPCLAEAVTDAIREVKNGHSLSDALRRHPEVFPPLYTSSIAAGERTGDLIPAIRGYIEFQKRVEAVRKKVVSSATYPAVLAGASVLVIGFLLAYVVPSFARIYLDSGAELPLPTRVLIRVTSFVKDYFPLFIIAAAAAVLLSRAYLKTKKGRAFVDRLKLAAPQFGPVYRGYSVAKFSRTLGMVLKSGTSIIEGLEMSKGVLNNSVLEEKIDRVIRKTREGSTVTDAMRAEDFMPEITLRMFSTGERSASLDAVALDIADYHDEEVNHRVGILTDLIEPALMIIMGAVIGTIVVLMYLPIFRLGARL